MEPKQIREGIEKVRSSQTLRFEVFDVALAYRGLAAQTENVSGVTGPSFVRDGSREWWYVTVDFQFIP